MKSEITLKLDFSVDNEECFIYPCSQFTVWDRKRWGLSGFYDNLRAQKYTGGMNSRLCYRIRPDICTSSLMAVENACLQSQLMHPGSYRIVSQ